MIAYLKGLVKFIGLNWLILDVNGVGYKIHIISNFQFPISNKNPKSKIQNLKLQIDQKRELYIYHHIREDRSELYGFSTINELQTFELLLQVNGVGPKMAMNIMGKSDLEKLSNAIAKGDSSFFLSMTGVGKKLATKIIIELKNKIGYDDLNIIENAELSTELVDAMESLGYKKNEIYPHIGKIPANIDSTEKKIKWLLKNMQK